MDAAYAAGVRYFDAARGAGTSPDALALAAVLAQPWADVVLSGAATEAELKSNLAVLALEPGPALLARLAVLQEAPKDYWETRAGLPWN